MAYIREITPETASADAREILDENARAMGYVPNYAKVFAHRPAVAVAWRGLISAIRANMAARRYELVTLAAASRLRSSYCMLAHGSVLTNRFLEPDALRAIVADHRSSGLDEVDIAVMDLAEKVADDATSVTQADIDRLRELGLTDPEILDVVLAAAARCFFSKVLDGVGARPDREYEDKLEPELREALTVGRPISD